jgi:hypothetical protein
MVIRADGRMKTLDGARVKSGESCGWLASRQPPKTGEMLQLDITDRLITTDKVMKFLEVIYDCRFLLRFNLDMIPVDIATSITRPGCDGKILVQPQSEWYWPKVVWRRPGIIDEDLCSFDAPIEDKGRQDSTRTVKRVTPAWIDMEWIRSLDAL